MSNQIPVPPLQYVGTLQFLGDVNSDQNFLVATQCHSINTPLITTAIIPGNTWTNGWDYVLYADGCQQWCTPNNTYFDLSTYHSGLGEYTISASVRGGPTGTLRTGKLALGSTSSVSGTRVAAFGTSLTMSGTDSIGVGNSSTVSGTNCLSVGNNHTVSGTNNVAVGYNCSVSSNNNFSGGSGAICSGFNSNFSYGSQITTGANNFALCQGKVTPYAAIVSNNSGCIGDGGEVTGSTKCYILGADSTCKIQASVISTMLNCGTNSNIFNSSRSTIINGNQSQISGRSGTVVITDGQTASSASISPGGDNMLQCRFNGGGVNGNATYWFSTDVNSNGVKMTYGSNSWMPIGSDSRLKTTVREFDYESILPCFERVPVYRYKYKEDDESIPLRTGFYADDFNKAFDGFVERQINKDHPYNAKHPDESPIETYSFADLSQVNFAGVRALYAKIKDLQDTVEQLQGFIQDLHRKEDDNRM